MTASTTTAVRTPRAAVSVTWRAPRLGRLAHRRRQQQPLPRRGTEDRRERAAVAQLVLLSVQPGEQPAQWVIRQRHDGLGLRGGGAGCAGPGAVLHVPVAAALLLLHRGVVA